MQPLQVGHNMADEFELELWTNKILIKVYLEQKKNSFNLKIKKHKFRITYSSSKFMLFIYKKN